MAEVAATVLAAIEDLVGRQAAAMERGVESMRQFGRTSATAGAGLLAALGLLQQSDLVVEGLGQLTLGTAGVGLAVVLVWSSTASSVAGHRLEFPAGPDPDVLVTTLEGGGLTKTNLTASRIEQARRAYAHNEGRLEELARTLRRQARVLVASILVAMMGLAYLLLRRMP